MGRIDWSLPVAEIAKQYGVTRQTVYNWRNKQQGRKPKGERGSVELAIQRWHDENEEASDAKVAQAVGCSPSAVKAWRDKGLETSFEDWDV